MNLARTQPVRPGQGLIRADLHLEYGIRYRRMILQHVVWVFFNQTD